ncbi:S-layer family protein [Tolypothrix sp. FACHB-123]|uniref:beta strand repeat-containing protein n=1 Tax=Tolypothrix sp. FACHB-123 TaxID=2692868 RepID=UPI0016881CBB|nr:S-layer family protein [Tolypothrix sp. FACHB-123]MBD2354519.1 S-layer family protein [Tolypothrix sp. FACHB-123]
MRAIRTVKSQRLNVFIATVNSVSLILGIILPAILLWSGCANAQVTSDSTTNTIVNSDGSNFTILNGVKKGNNLFHSFSKFSVPNGGSATFDLVNTPNITTIFSRVTGGNVSDIQGLISTINTQKLVSLFLINPAGIVFGENARLNIGGSFVGTTANSIKFADGVEFSAINSQNQPLLSINVPIGLQMGNNPVALAQPAAGITIQGTGHSLDNANGQPPIIVAPSATELRVQPGQTLALVGGNLFLNGATLTAKQGQIELGSVSGAGLVSLIPTAQGYTLGYENGQSFGDIQIAQKSLLDVSGVNAGSVQIQGRHIQFTDGSLVLSQNFGDLPGRKIHLQASATIDMIGASDTSIWSGIRIETFGIASGSNISVMTPKLTLQQGAGLNSTTLGTATGGNIEVQAGAIEISGFSPINPTGVSSLSTGSYGSGNAGDVLVNGNSLVISDGASLSSFTFTSGSSGKVTVSNKNTTVMGESVYGVYSNLSSTTLATGNAKTLTLDTARLQILDGGVVAATTFYTGHGGDLNINATESIEVSGRSRSNNSSINSSVLHLPSQLQQVLEQRFGLPNLLAANAGNATISTPNLILTDGGSVSVTSQGSGNGGNLNITANNIRLERQASIQAQTESGNGGNLTLQVGQLLMLRDKSAIAATAGGNGDGGNININAPIIVGIENSDIIANAFRGRGGKIQIATQGMIGLQFRPQLTPENDITASSQFGMSGTVQINNIGADPNSGLIELPVNVTDPSQQIATGCASDQGSKFVATGRGGIPENPIQEVKSDRTWSDVRDLTAYRQNNAFTAKITPYPDIIVQATSWHRRADGKIELVASQSSIERQQPLTCAAIPKS